MEESMQRNPQVFKFGMTSGPLLGHLRGAGSSTGKAGGTEEGQVQYLLESCGHLSLSLVLG